MELLYQDRRVIVCVKPAGVLSTDEPGGLPGLLREALGDSKACVRTVHRLDQVVGGVMVLARSREAAKRLSLQVQNHEFKKTYLAVVGGKVEPPQGTLRDLLLRSRSERKTYVVTAPGKDVQEAILHYRVLDCREDLTLVEIQLETGRTHQIRCQFAHFGHPLAGDVKYGGETMEMEGIALWSYEIGFRHPETEAWMRFSALPPKGAPWERFALNLPETDRKEIDHYV